MNWKKLALGSGSAGVLLAALVGTYEGTRYVPYRDVTGIWTDCSGNTHEVNPEVRQTVMTCKGIDAKNEELAFQSLHKYVTYPLTRNETVAFADFIYNVGEQKFARASMLREINQGRVSSGCRELLRWVYAGGKRLQGLVKRRQAEYVICTTAEK